MEAETETLAAAKWRWLRPEVQAYARRMEMHLRAQDADRGRAGWKGDHPDALFNHLREEVEELRQLLTQWDAVESDEEQYALQLAIGGEAADIGNLAMMVADVLGAWTDPEAPHAE